MEVLQVKLQGAQGNTCGLPGKEIDLINKMKKTKSKYMAITQTKKKGQGCETLEDRFILLYSSMPETQRVVCLIHKEN